MKIQKRIKILTGLNYLLNIIAKCFFLAVMFYIGWCFLTNQDDYTEKLLKNGPNDKKIAVITLEGLIYESKACAIINQIEKAQQDKNIRGLIIQISTSGGRVDSSDAIYRSINDYRKQTGNPVVAFLRGVAASGGYYVSVACDRIVAEPTVITGSIGVIVKHYNLDALANKVGIKPVIFKIGEKKDWPSPFREISKEEEEYVINEKLYPFYNRFKKVVKIGRPALTVEAVEVLADGSIYSAEDSLENGLIDKIGYFTDTLDYMKEEFGIDKMQVVQYCNSKRRFGFNWPGLLFSTSDGETMMNLFSPSLMYLMD